MSDISKCTGTGCPFKKDCYRFTAPMSEYRQAIFSPPIKNGKCDYYWGKKPEKIWSKKKD